MCIHGCKYDLNPPKCLRDFDRSLHKSQGLVAYEPGILSGGYKEL